MQPTRPSATPLQRPAPSSPPTPPHKHGQTRGDDRGSRPGEQPGSPSASISRHGAATGLGAAGLLTNEPRELRGFVPIDGQSRKRQRAEREEHLMDEEVKEQWLVAIEKILAEEDDAFGWEEDCGWLVDA